MRGTKPRASRAGGRDASRGLARARHRQEATSLAGGGICARIGGAVTDLTVQSNTTGNAAAGIDGVDAVLEGLVVSDNVAGLTGGGMTVYGSVEILGCTISNNEAFDGGGIETFFSTSVVVVEDSFVLGNVATFFTATGSGTHVSDGQLRSVNTDWGSGGTDNLPGDVSLDTAGVTYGAGAAATFDCDDGPWGTCQ